MVFSREETTVFTFIVIIVHKSEGKVPENCIVGVKRITRRSVGTLWSVLMH